MERLIYLEVQDDLPYQSQDYVRIAVGQIRSVIVDQLEPATTEHSEGLKERNDLWSLIEVCPLIPRALRNESIITCSFLCTFDVCAYYSYKNAAPLLIFSKFFSVSSSSNCCIRKSLSLIFWALCAHFVRSVYWFSLYLSSQAPDKLQLHFSDCLCPFDLWSACTDHAHARRDARNKK